VSGLKTAKKLKNCVSISLCFFSFTPFCYFCHFSIILETFSVFLNESVRYFESRRRKQRQTERENKKNNKQNTKTHQKRKRKQAENKERNTQKGTKKKETRQ
jgi:hypothetical protein